MSRYNKDIITQDKGLEATELLHACLDVLEKHAPDYYYGSDLVAECDDYLKSVEN